MLIKILLCCLKTVYCGYSIPYYNQRNLRANFYGYIFIDKGKRKLFLGLFKYRGINVTPGQNRYFWNFIFTSSKFTYKM